MHPRNIHRHQNYNFEALLQVNPELDHFIFKNDYNTLTIDFANPKAVIALNKAILLLHYGITNWEIPEGFLCPPIPSRADYIHYIADLLKNESDNISGIDIGVGANAIYSILGAKIYQWNMVGSDINLESVKSAKKNISFTKELEDKVIIIHQSDNANIFEGVIKKDRIYDFTMCNPPFHKSEKEALKGTLRKLNNLNNKQQEKLNFGGQANELWCNGGEALFLKRMIKQSVDFRLNVKFFTSLVSKKENLPKLEKQLLKLNTSFKTIPMEHGNKKTRIIAWSFTEKL